MRHRRRRPPLAVAVVIVLASFLLLLLPTTARAHTVDDGDGEGEPGAVTLRGRVVCVEGADTRPSSAEGAPSAADPCVTPGARFELRTDAGERFGFLPDDRRAQMFVDPRVRERALEIRGWKRPGGALEILYIHSIVAGEPHRIHYRCDVCNIDATAPGPCWCCGQEFELREVPLASTDDAERHPR